MAAGLASAPSVSSGENGSDPDRIGDPVGGVRRLTSGRVLVLNASYEPLNVCTTRRALVLLLKEKAEILEVGEGVLRSEKLSIDRPQVIRLITFVRVPRDIHRRRITRRAVLARDGWTCQYCGSSRSGLTVDHVVPRSRGGESIWENIVASCAPCNRRKGDHLPAQANMHPRRRPSAPSPHVFIHVASPSIPAAWRQWLPEAA
jgi:5-methylcytosine-specific restriction endonuclease McrA